MVDSNAALLATAIHRKPARMHPKGCAGGGRPEDPSTGDQMQRACGQQLKESYRRSCPKGTWLKFSAMT